MTLKEIQDDVNKWTSQFTPQYWPPHEILARLMEEVGELAREINHLHGQKKKKDTETEQKIDEEIGDVIFTLCCLANSKEINLSESWKIVMDKCYKRDNSRFVKK